MATAPFTTSLTSTPASDKRNRKINDQNISNKIRGPFEWRRRWARAGAGGRGPTSKGVYSNKACPALSRNTRARTPGVLELPSVPVTIPSRDGSILLPYPSSLKTSISL
ncbi:hypothetical protein EVAR_83394_1 [Eumeta japonica]|uniref:Uncharacterized protein n=1 Tax=Eumeta variegata TaxID=151549 RepID=A0A4C1TYE5_EUMVA|nr:hypothetical protein EVAR_83394_1 [Eumeta japonica]